MRKIVDNYNQLVFGSVGEGIPAGDSASPKDLIFHIFDDLSSDIKVLDVGFGAGTLGRKIKMNQSTHHWQIDGVDGWEMNCLNQDLISDKIYCNIWHGLAQEIPSENFKEYNIICLLDVIEHLDPDSAKWLIRSLFTFMADDAMLFISTPLWFYPQSQQQDGDLEEHLIGVPVTSMMALLPYMYSVSYPLIGGFVYGKRSLNYIDFFQPTVNKKFSYEMGLNIFNSLGVPFDAGVVYKTSL